MDINNLAALDAKTGVTAGETFNVGGADGGLFRAVAVADLYASSTLVLRVIPHVYLARLEITGPGTAGETFAIKNHTIELVASGSNPSQTAQQVELPGGTSPTAADLAERITSYINRNSAAIGVRARGGPTVYVYANLAASLGNYAVSSAAATFAWKIPDGSAATSTLVDPAIGSTIHFGSDTITFGTSSGTGQIQIGSSPQNTAAAIKAYFDANAAALGFTCARSGLDLTLTATSAAGLERLRKFRKGVNDCNFLVVQERNGAAADSLGALYRVSTGTSGIVNLRESVTQDRTLRPDFWGVYGDARDTASILDRMNAMHDAAHYLGCKIELAAGGDYDITPVGETEEPNCIRFRSIALHGNGATIRNNANEEGNGGANTLNSVYYFGIGHPAYESAIAFYTINAADQGDREVTFANSAATAYFRAGDVVPISTVAGRTARTVWHPEARDFYRVDEVTTTGLRLDRGLVSDFPAGSRAGLWMGVFDKISFQDIFIADRPLVRDLNLSSPHGGAMIRSHAYDVDLEFGALEGFYCVFINSMTGRFRARKVRAKQKGIELAQQSQAVSVHVDAIEWWPNDKSRDTPVIKVGENSRDWTISYNVMRIANGKEGTTELPYKGDAAITVIDGARGSLKGGVTEIEALEYYVDVEGQAPELTGGTYFMLQSATSLPYEVKERFTDLDLDFGVVHYGGTPNRLVWTQNGSGEVRRVWISGGRFHGLAGTDGAWIQSHDGGIGDNVFVPGTLHVDGDGGVFRGHFTGGYATSLSTGTPRNVTISSG